ncbi:MAG: undecaprenyl-diphosphatase UppP [Candidatus Omnitrophica bacterium]|nr:undecaprenyl-diphosphatase UppP [Candidatus Omnitrophota bacterium]
MNILQAVILGIVEGITEFLPISSTGHLILTARFLGITQTEFVKSFEIAIQSGAILAVVLLYYKTLLKSINIWKKIMAAFLPTAIIAGLLYKVIKGFLLESSTVVLWALFLGGLALIIFEVFHREKQSALAELSQMSYTQALLIGLFQSLAIIPGISRSAATIIAGLGLGLKRKAIVEFSFLLAIPTMAAAMALDLTKSAYAFSGLEFLVLAVGFFTSFLVALTAIRFLLIFIRAHTFISFGVYRMLLAALFWLKIR